MDSKGRADTTSCPKRVLGFCMVEARHFGHHFDPNVFVKDWGDVLLQRNLMTYTRNNGNTQFCRDFRHLNAVTIPDTYPLQRMDDCIQSLLSCQYNRPFVAAGWCLVWRRRWGAGCDKKNSSFYSSGSSMEILESANQKWELRQGFILPFTLVPTAALVYHLAYATRLLRSNVHWILFYLDFNEKRV